MTSDKLSVANPLRHLRVPVYVIVTLAGTSIFVWRNRFALLRQTSLIFLRNAFRTWSASFQCSHALQMIHLSSRLEDPVVTEPKTVAIKPEERG